MDEANVPLTQTASITRQRLTVQGVVQGVGFRPFVYGLASRLELAGLVGNDSSGVFIEIEGPPPTLAAFHERLIAEVPPLAHIESVTMTPMPPRGETTFVIAHSQTRAEENTLISPDVSICSNCLREVFTSGDRRCGYPFTNCTNCGPRFTIIRDIPYDRPLTTMAAFAMCPACQTEYDDPLNRRFHAQPNACPLCGPQVEFRWSPHSNSSPQEGLDNFLPFEGIDPTTSPPLGRIDSTTSPPLGGIEGGPNPIHLAQTVIAQGGIVAVKGLGGFHLACDAANDQAVQTLRQRKGRVDKPFAVMALDIETITQFAEINPEEEALLTGKERPIVLLKKKSNSPLSELIAPGNPYIGVMLPYTPLHYLLLNGQEANNERRIANNQPSNLPTFQSPITNYQSPILIMTSANYSDEPIVKDNDEALERLARLADAFLLHNRDIHVHCDDSVIRVFAGQELPIRRSRGYAPFPVKLPFAVQPTLAVGGELKATFCLAKGNYAFMSQHIGDMENLETLQVFERSAAHFKAIFRIEPEIVACDMHPGYLSSKWAEKQQGNRGAEEQGSRAQHLPHPPAPSPLRVIKIQHHHAHIAAVMAENELDGQQPVIGFSFDGTGYGTDGAIWGGEALVADYKGFQRVAHLKYVPLPGGDAAVKRPYRMALAHLWAAEIPWTESLPPVAACTAVERGIIKRQLETGLNAVPTSSMGRLFDAVAALVEVRQRVTYEAQAAIELEAIAAQHVSEGYQFDLSLTAEGMIEFEAKAVIQAIVADLQTGISEAIIAAKFHHAVADVVLQLSLRLREREGFNQVALSGGVFQNVTLLKQIVARLRSANFEVLTHRLVPPNDGGLALGQAIISNQLSVTSYQ